MARRFTSALLSREQGPSRRASRALKATATPSLARSLLAAPPRGQPPPAPSRVWEVRCYGPFYGQLKASIWLRTGDKPPWLLELELAVHHGGWRVAHLTP